MNIRKDFFEFVSIYTREFLDFNEVLYHHFLNIEVPIIDLVFSCQIHGSWKGYFKFYY